MKEDGPRLWIAVCLMASAVASGNVRASTSKAADTAWEWSVTPYIWLADTSYRLRANDQDLGTGDVDFGELAETLDGAFQVVAEAGRGKWSGFVDFTYLSMSDSQLVDLSGLGPLKLSTRSEQLFVDAAVAYWPWPEVSGFNLYAGLRYTDLDGRIRADLVDPDTRLGQIDADRRFTDVLIGFRDRFKLVENLALVIRMDYGFADSDGVFLAQGALRWAVGRERRQGIVLGYRYKDAELAQDNREERYKYKGPVLGFNFRF